MSFLSPPLNPLVPAYAYLCPVNRWHVYCKACDREIGGGGCFDSRSQAMAQREAEIHNEFHEEEGAV